MTSLDFKNYSKNLRIIWSFLQDIMTCMALHLVAYSGLFGSTTIVTESPKMYISSKHDNFLYNFFLPTFF